MPSREAARQPSLCVRDAQLVGVDELGEGVQHGGNPLAILGDAHPAPQVEALHLPYVGSRG